jgi:hypothetical protein
VTCSRIRRVRACGNRPVAAPNPVTIAAPISEARVRGEQGQLLGERLAQRQVHGVDLSMFKTEDGDGILGVDGKHDTAS